MIGRRIDHPDVSSLDGVEPGDYWQTADGHWWVAGPVPRYDGHLCLIADVTSWTVTEHEDRTITVSPSIFWGRDGYPGSPPEWAAAHTWHGFLERGVWRSV